MKEMISCLLTGYRESKRFAFLMIGTFVLSCAMLLQFPGAGGSASGRGTLLPLVPFVVPPFTLVVLVLSGRAIKRNNS